MKSKLVGISGALSSDLRAERNWFLLLKYGRNLTFWEKLYDNRPFAGHVKWRYVTTTTMMLCQYIEDTGKAFWYSAGSHMMPLNFTVQMVY